MAEGGIAASMGNVNSKDNWQVHFRDTMRGGKFLNNWRMAELHAKEAPDRVWELETYGALFDRTPEGKISQRNFGGHEYPRLAHVGDRTGLELIRTLQQKIVSLQQEDLRERGDAEARIKVFAECTITELLKDERRDRRRASATGASPARSSSSTRPAVVLATGGIGKSFKVTSNSWEYTGDGHALAHAGRRRRCINMEFIQFHPTGMVWPPERQGHPRHRVRARRRRRADATPRASASCSTTSPTSSARSTRRPRRRPTAGTPTRTTTSAHPSCCPATRSPARSTPRSRPAAARPHGGVFLDVSTRLPAEVIRKKLPSMWHQFKELADVDITAEPMEVGPTCHYVMGGVEVDPDTSGGRASPGCSPPARSPAACTARTASAATRCPTCWCSAAAPGSAPRTTSTSLGDVRPDGRRRGSSTRPRPRPLAPFADDGGENPYTLHQELQQTMNDLVGIIRTAAEVARGARQARGRSRPARRRSPSRATAQFNPGWHLALDLRQHAARLGVRRPGGAGARRSPAAATPATTSRAWTPSGARSTSSAASTATASTSTQQPLPVMRADLLDAVRRVDELTKYLTAEELDRCCRRRSALMGYEGHVPGVARRRHRRRTSGLRRRGQRGRGRPRRHPPAPGHRRPPTSPSAGTARPASAARAAPRSTAARGCCA